MRIALFHLGFFYSGGGEKLILEEIRGLRALGHEVECFAPFVDRESCFPDYPEIREIRSLLPPPPRWLPMKDPLWVLLSCLLIPIMAPRFRSFDLLLGANQPGPWFAFVLSRILGKPYVVYLAQALRLLHPRVVDLENGIRIREGDHRFLMAIKRAGGFLIDWADRLSIRHAATVLANGGHVRRWLEVIYGVNAQSIAAGCHPIADQKLSYERRRDGTVSVNGTTISKPFVLLTNRHSPMKRFEYAIWAMKAIRRSIPGLGLVITGQETEYTEQLRYLVESLRIPEAVTFVGLLSEHDLARLYREATVYVYPSPEEDFGMGIVEAMAAGTPVVAWRNGGPTVTVKDRETGFLVEPYDTNAFADNIQRLATSPELAERMGRAGHRRARELFSYERHNRLLEQALIEAFRAQQAAPEMKGEALPAPAWSQEEVHTTSQE